GAYGKRAPRRRPLAVPPGGSSAPPTNLFPGGCVCYIPNLGRNSLHCTPPQTPCNEFLLPPGTAMANVNFPQEYWDHEVVALPDIPVDWLWHGFVAGGNVTLLTSQWKAGKTTLLSLLLSRRKQGGQLAGLPVKPGKTVVVSEEPASL